MPRKSAAALKPEQPDLLGSAPQTAKPAPKSRLRGATARQIIQDDPHKPEVAKPAVNKGNLTVVKNTPTNTLAVLIEAMSKKDAANLQIVAGLHKEMIVEQARLDFTVAHRALSRVLPRINRDGKIEYKDKGDGRGKATLRFASYENIHASIKDPLDAHGFDLWFSSEPGAPGMLNVIGHLDHESGHNRVSVLPMPHDASGGKSGAQGWASAFSFGKRIVTIGLLNLVTYAPEDRDLDGNKAKVTKAGKPQVIDGKVLVDPPKDDEQVEVCNDEQVMKLREAIEACGCGDKLFCKHWQIEKVSQLPAADYQDALAGCRQYAAKRAGA